MRDAVVTDDQGLNVDQVGGKSATADDLTALWVLNLNDAGRDSIRDVCRGDG